MTDGSEESAADRDGRRGNRCVSRRDLLGALSAVGTAAVAGCQSVLSGGGVNPSWEYDIDSAWAVSPPALVDGTVVVGAQDKALHVVDAGSGDRRLRAETSGWIDVRPAVPVENAGPAPTVHAHSSDGDLYGVGLDDGIEWYVEGNRPNALTVRAGDIVVHSPGGESATSTDTVAYRAADGEVLWRHGASAQHVYRGGERAIVEVHDPTNVERHFLVALDTTDGSVAWETDPERVAGAAGTDDGLTVLASAEEIYGVRTSDGGERWRRPLEEDLGYFLGARFGAHVYLSVEDGEDERLVALDRESGQRQWSERIKWEAEGLTATDQHVFVARYKETDDGSIIRIVALDSDGNRQWETDTAQGNPREFLIGGSTLLVNHGDTVHALDVESGDRRWRHSPDTSHVRVVADDDSAYVSHTGEGRVLALPL